MKCVEIDINIDAHFHGKLALERITKRKNVCLW